MSIGKEVVVEAGYVVLIGVVIYIVEGMNEAYIQGYVVVISLGIKNNNPT